MRMWRLPPFFLVILVFVAASGRLGLPASNSRNRRMNLIDAWDSVTQSRDGDAGYRRQPAGTGDYDFRGKSRGPPRPGGWKPDRWHSDSNDGPRPV